MKIFKKIIIVLSVAGLTLSTLYCKKDSLSPGIPVNSGPAIKGFSSHEYGYAVYDIKNRRLVMDHNIYTGFIPASVTKLFTAVFAYKTLGRNFTFSTEIYYTGKIINGEITGDLYIKGTGDPELTVYDLALLAEQLEEEGVKAVAGNFYYDETLFRQQEVFDSNMPDYASYNSGIGALNLNKNTIQAVRRDGENNEPFYYEFLPHVESITSVTYNEPPVFPYISYSYENEKETWNLPSKKIIAPRYILPVKRTGSYTASVFAILCSIHGIILKNPVPAPVPGNSKELCRHTGRQLDKIIPDMLISSDNLTAEILGRLAYKRYSEDEGSSMDFTQAAAFFFKEQFSSVTSGDFRLINASGLSSRNRLTPEQALAFLIDLSREFRLESMLPMSGERGTLRSRLDTPVTAYRVYAKTGSIYYSSALAGLFYGSSGRKYLFALFIDSKESRKHLDSKKIKDMADSATAGRWTKKAVRAADSFISGIINKL